MNPIPVYVFVIWHRGMGEADMVMRGIRERFTVLKQFDVTWRPRDYVRNFAAFYGWKALKCRRPDIALAYARGTLAGIFGLYETRYFQP